VRRKAERVRFCTVSKRSANLGRFIPVSSKEILALAPLNDSHKVSPHTPSLPMLCSALPHCCFFAFSPVECTHLVCEGIQRKCNSYCLPVSPKYSLGLEQHITTHRAGLQSNRIALLRAKQLQDHLGFSIMSPTSPVSPTSPLRWLVHTEAGSEHAAQMQSPQGVKDWECVCGEGGREPEL
jgi:hypothetical protein